MVLVWDKEGEASMGEQKNRPTDGEKCGTRFGFNQIS